MTPEVLRMLHIEHVKQFLEHSTIGIVRSSFLPSHLSFINEVIIMQSYLGNAIWQTAELIGMTSRQLVYTVWNQCQHILERHDAALEVRNPAGFFFFRLVFPLFCRGFS
jgi:hypothetical protein